MKSQESKQGLIEKPPPCLEKNELFEKLLEETGGWGRCQSILLSLTLVLAASCSFNHFTVTFTAYSPKFNCSSSDGQLFTQCRENSQCWNVSFDQSVMSRSVVTDFKLICDDRSSMVTIINSSYMAGVLVINLVIGFLSDHFGRRRVFLLASLAHVIASFATAFATSFWQFVVLRFFVGGTVHGAWSVGFILMNELSVVSKRGMVAGILNGGWSLGSMAMTLSAYFLRDWVHMQLVVAFMASSTLFLYFLLPESPRWLLLNGRFDACEEVYKKLASLNGVDLKGSFPAFQKHFQQLCQILKLEKEEDRKRPTRGVLAEWVSFLTYSEYRKRFLLLAVIWFAVGFSAFGIHYSVSLVDYDIFVVSLAKDSAAAFVVAVLTLLYDRVNRGPLMFSTYFLGGLFGLSILFLPAQMTHLRVLTYLMAQGVTVACFVLANGITAEVISTDARSTTFVLVDGISKLGSMLAPFVVLLGGGSGGGDPSVPQAVFGAAMAAGAAAFLFTQETRGRPLAQTVKDLQDEDRRAMLKC